VFLEEHNQFFSFSFSSNVQQNNSSLIKIVVLDNSTHKMILFYTFLYLKTINATEPENEFECIILFKTLFAFYLSSIFCQMLMAKFGSQTNRRIC